jgi:hypothetical protein
VPNHLKLTDEHKFCDEFEEPRRFETPFYSWMAWRLYLWSYVFMSNSVFPFKIELWVYHFPFLTNYFYLMFFCSNRRFRYVFNQFLARDKFAPAFDVLFEFYSVVDHNCQFPNNSGRVKKSSDSRQLDNSCCFSQNLNKKLTN